MRFDLSLERLLALLSESQVAMIYISGYLSLSIFVIVSNATKTIVILRYFSYSKKISLFPIYKYIETVDG